MVTVFNTTNVGEAQQVASMLRANGVETFIPDDVISNVAPHHLIATGGIAVQVAEADAERARDLLKNSQGAAGAPQEEPR